MTIVVRNIPVSSLPRTIPRDREANVHHAVIGIPRGIQPTFPR